MQTNVVVFLLLFVLMVVSADDGYFDVGEDDDDIAMTAAKTAAESTKQLSLYSFQGRTFATKLNFTYFLGEMMVYFELPPIMPEGKTYNDSKTILISLFDDVLVNIAWQPRRGHLPSVKIYDPHLPLMDSRWFQMLFVDTEDMTQLAYIDYQIAEFRGEAPVVVNSTNGEELMPYLTRLELLKQEALMLAETTVETVETEQKEGALRFVAFGNIEDMRSLLLDGWHGIVFTFSIKSAITHLSPQEIENLLEIHVSDCADEDCIWSYVQTSPLFDYPAVHLLNVDIGTCITGVLKNLLISKASPATVRIVFPGNAPLGLKMKVHFDMRFEPRRRPLQLAGMYGCSLSALLDVFVPRGYAIASCSSDPHVTPLPEIALDHTEAPKEATREAIGRVVVFEKGLQSSNIWSCMQAPTGTKDCDSFATTFAPEELNCQNLEMNFAKDPEQIIQRMRQYFQILSYLITEDDEHSIDVSLENGGFLSEFARCRCSLGDEVVRLFWTANVLSLLHRGSAFGLSQSAAIPLKHHDNSNDTCIPCQFHNGSLSSAVSPSSCGIVQFWPMNVNKERTLLNIACDSNGSLSFVAHSQLANSGTFDAVAIRLSSENAVVSKAMGFPDANGKTIATFRSRLPVGMYIVEMLEYRRGMQMPLQGGDDRWRAQNSKTLPFIRNVGVLNATTAAAADVAPSGQLELLRDGLWVKRQQSTTTQVDAIHPEWQWQSRDRPFLELSGQQKEECFSSRRTMLFLGDSHLRDLYFELLHSSMPFGDPSPSVALNKHWYHRHGWHYTSANGTQRAFVYSQTALLISSRLEAIFDAGTQPPSPSSATATLGDATTTASSDLSGTVFGQHSLPSAFKLFNDSSVVIVSFGFWDIEIYQHSPSNMRFRTGVLGLIATIHAIHSVLPGLTFVFVTSPPLGTRIPQQFEAINDEIIKIFREKAPHVVILNWFDAILSATGETGWMDGYHVGATCSECNTAGRPITRLAVSALANQFCY